MCSGATTASRSASSRPSGPRRDARVGQQQAKLYADCLEKQFGQRPVIFYTNGYEHWLWDDAALPAARRPGLLPRTSWNSRSSGAATAEATRHRTDRSGDRRALLPDARHPAGRRGVRARPPAQGAAGDGDRRGQDPHRHRALRSADAGELGQAGPVPRGPGRARQPGGERVQAIPAVVRRPSTSSPRRTPRAGSTSPPIRR